MKYCTTCGKELADNAISCPNCGYVFPNAGGASASGVHDAPSFGVALLGFFIPLVGIILYFVWKPATPLRAKSAGKGALVSIILNVIFYIILAATGALSYFYY